MRDDNAGGIASYYDNLSRFLDFARGVGRGGGAQHGSTHRFLAALPDENDDGTLGPERLDAIVLAAATTAGLAASPRVLDAGCGLGGTIFYWQARRGGTYDGLTLSPEQCRRAGVEAARRDLSAVCRFHRRSYQDPLSDSPLAGPFDAAIGIESFAHSPDPTATVTNIAQVLAPGGLLLIVDDMPTPEAPRHMLDAFKTHWRCPVLADQTTYQTALANAGLTLLHNYDLTARLRPRSYTWLKFLIVGFGLARYLAPTRSARDVLGALLGGFYLETLYRVSGMRYRLLVATKQRPDTVSG